MKGFFLLVSIPYLVASWLCDRFGGRRWNSDLSRCINIVNRDADRVPVILREALVLAEDHRNTAHLGVDQIGMLRAGVVWAATGKIEGASTIEQQFARTITGRYERTFRRKLREQVMAVSLCRRVPKYAILSAYLSNAFYGARLVGLGGLIEIVGRNSETIGYGQALAAVAHLKYPKPEKYDEIWRAKIRKRVSYLMQRSHWTANNALHPSLDTGRPPLPLQATCVKRV